MSKSKMDLLIDERAYAGQVLRGIQLGKPQKEIWESRRLYDKTIFELKKLGDYDKELYNFVEKEYNQYCNIYRKNPSGK